MQASEIVRGTMVEGMQEKMDRRGVLRMMAGAGAAAVAGTASVKLSGEIARAEDFEAAATGFYRTTTHLNLRSAATTSASVITVMPPQALVTSLGESKNGFRKVAFQGKAGWAHRDYLTISNGGSANSPVIIGSATVSTALNLRSGPSNGHQVLRVMAAGDVVEISDRVEYGYRYVIHNGLAGFAYDEYLDGDGPSGSALTTTTYLNFRAEPHTTAKILAVMPPGASAPWTDQIVNGFRKTVYQGKHGWAYDDYLV